MFLVQHMIETKDKEIAKLMEHKNMRKMGLHSSEKLLEKDTQSFIEFFADIKSQATDAAHKLEQLRKKRATEHNRLK